MIRSIYICFILIFIVGTTYSQQINRNKKPLYVPFEVDGSHGLTDTFGQEFVKPGTYKAIINSGDFNYYIIGEQKKEVKEYALSYWIMDPQTGKKIDLGELQDSDPAFYKGDTAYYHFLRSGKSVLATPLASNTYAFDRTYDDIKGIKLYDTAGNNFKQVFITTLPGYDKEVWLLNGAQPEKVSQIKPEYKIETIRSFVESGYSHTSFAVGLAVRTTKAAPKPPVKKTQPPAKTKKGLIPPPVMAPPPPPPISSDINETDFYANIYNYELQLLGKSTTDKAALSKLFGKEAYLRSQSEASVSIGGGIIKQTGDNYSTQLNDTYAIERILKTRGNYGTQNYYLVKNEKDGTLTEIASLENTPPYWASFNGKKLLKFYFHKSKRLSAYFDYDGVAMPKAKLMIPAKYYDEQQEPGFIPFLIR